MTREEKIALLKDIIDGEIIHPNVRKEIGEWAIKALEQEPCEDAVSRQAVLDIIDSDWKYEGMEQYINELPPVIPQPKTGHWIGNKEYPICPKCYCNIIEEYISYSEYAEMYKPMKYCPNCGAKMVEPQESEDKE